MSHRPPEIIDAFDFVEKRRVIEGIFPLSRMDRLCGMLLDSAGEAQFCLQFDREDGAPVVRGSVTAKLVLRCQRCLSALHETVNTDFALALVSSIDEANRLQEPLEPLMLDEPPSLQVLDIVEDEILLAIPQVPRHHACESQGISDATTVADGEEPMERKPFAGLAALMQSNKKTF